MDICKETILRVTSLKVEKALDNHIIKTVHAGEFGEWKEFQVASENFFACGM